jgi:hypothetical protein
MVKEMVSEFQGLIGERCEHDSEARLGNHSSFSIWMWSCPRLDSAELEVSWSAVMAGGIVAESGFVATVTLFLFDSRNKLRLVAADGKSFIEYRYSREGEWKNCGWIEDEWNEWSGINYPGGT